MPRFELESMLTHKLCFCFPLVLSLQGSGKTYTMQGPKEDPGVNTRALARLFEVAQERFPDVKYEIKITLLEIYNEKIQVRNSSE